MILNDPEVMAQLQRDAETEIAFDIKVRTERGVLLNIDEKDVVESHEAHAFVGLGEPKSSQLLVPGPRNSSESSCMWASYGIRSIGSLSGGLATTAKCHIPCVVRTLDSTTWCLSGCEFNTASTHRPIKTKERAGREVPSGGASNVCRPLTSANLRWFFSAHQSLMQVESARFHHKELSFSLPFASPKEFCYHLTIFEHSTARRTHDARFHSLLIAMMRTNGTFKPRQGKGQKGRNDAQGNVQIGVGRARPSHRHDG